MNTFDDLEDMASLYLDATTTELLISGAVEIDDAPPGFGRVAGLINKAQGAPTAEELAARTAIVTAFAAKVRSRPVVPARTKRTFAFPKFSAKVLALTAPVVLLGGGVAAGTNSLPPPAQAVVARALSSIGISVPKPQIDNDALGGSPISSTGGVAATSRGPDSSPRSRATVGLCRAWRAGGLSYPSTAYRNLATEAGGVDHLPAYCAGVSPSASLGATGHAATPSFGQLGGRKGVTRSSTTRGKKIVVHAAHRLSPAIAIRHAGTVASRRAAASTSTPTTTTGRHGPKAAGTSRPPVVSRGRLPVSGGLQAPGGTHKATTSGRSRHHRPSTKAGQGKPRAPTSSTQGGSGTTSPVQASPVSPSKPSGHGPSHHHGRNGRPGRPRGCTDTTRSGRLVQTHQPCHPVTPKGSNGTSPTGSTRQGRRAGPRR